MGPAAIKHSYRQPASRTRIEAMNLGFAHHLVKPVDLNKLDSLIQEMSLGQGSGPFDVMPVANC